MYCLKDKKDLDDVLNILRRRYVYVNFFTEKVLFDQDIMFMMARRLGYKIAGFDFSVDHVPHIGYRTAYFPENRCYEVDDLCIQKKYPFMFSLTTKSHISQNIKAHQTSIELQQSGECFYVDSTLGQIFIEDDELFLI